MMDPPELWTAIFSRRYDVAYHMISRGADVNETSDTEYDDVTTMLHYAVILKDNRCIRVLANLGANFNARDSKDRTPLHWAAGCGLDADVVEEIINEGAVVDARDHNQMTPLHCSVATYDNVESAKLLIARGASINAVNADGWTVLHMAVVWNNLEMVKMLISHKVNVDAKDNIGYTPLLCYFTEFTKGEHKTEIVELLLNNGADVNSKTNNSAFCLFLAVKLNSLASLYLLLKRGARVNEVTERGYTALHVACQKGLADVTALLLKFGADLNARNCNGRTPFELLKKRPSNEPTAQIIIKEAVKRKASGQFLCEEYKQMAQSCQTYSRYEQVCLEEIKQMQSEKIDEEDSAISFFDILSMEEEKLATLARHESIVTAFESSSYATSFRIYASELTTKFAVAKKGAKLPAPIVQKLAGYIKYGYTYNQK